MWIGSALIAAWLFVTAPQRLRTNPRHAAFAFLAGAFDGVGPLGVRRIVGPNGRADL